MRQIICFGDSLTAGWDGSHVTPRLNERLENRLGCAVINAGVPGETTRQALRRIDEKVVHRFKNGVTVLFGSNDASFHKGIPIDEYEANLLEIARRLNDVPVLMITPPPVIEACQIGKRKNARLACYASVVRKVAANLQLPLADFHQLMEEQQRLQNLLLADGLHLSDSGYDLLAQLIEKYMLDMLNKK